jgi:hypothetical protein
VSDDERRVAAAESEARSGARLAAEEAYRAERAEMLRFAAAAWRPRPRPQTPFDVLLKENHNQ